MRICYVTAVRRCRNLADAGRLGNAGAGRVATSRKRDGTQTGGRRAWAALGKMPGGRVQTGATTRRNRGGTQLVERRGLAVAACGKWICYT